MYNWNYTQQLWVYKLEKKLRLELREKQDCRAPLYLILIGGLLQP
jgi:hypothetical protein